MMVAVFCLQSTYRTVHTDSKYREREREREREELLLYATFSTHFAIKILLRRKPFHVNIPQMQNII